MTHIPYLTSTVGPASDRRTRLLVMGILLLMLGGLCLLITLATTFLLFLRPGGMPAVPWERVIMQMLIYTGAVALFGAMGIGSIFRRRWARPLVLGIAWPWLIGGIAGTALVAYTMLQMVFNANGGTSPFAGQPFIALVVICFSVLGYIGVPLTMILTYNSPAVQSTLDFYDPHPRWTDGVPIRVLSLCIVMVGSSLGILANAFIAVMPFFGILLKGPAAIVVMLLISATFLLASWWCYRLEMRGWILALALFIIMPISAAVTFTRVSTLDLYRAMGSTDQEIEMMKQMKLAGTGPAQLIIWAAAGAALGIGYLVFVRKCFTSRPEPSEPSMAQTVPLEQIV